MYKVSRGSLISQIPKLELLPSNREGSCNGKPDQLVLGVLVIILSPVSSCESIYISLCNLKVQANMKYVNLTVASPSENRPQSLL